MPASFTDAFIRGLRDLGYVEGQNIFIDRYRTEGAPGHSAPEVVRLGVDVIVATGTGAVLGAKKATQTIPIVMAPSADAVAGGLIDSLARPGGNITGLTMISSDLTGKRLELIKEAVPGVTHIAAVYPLGTASTAIAPWLKDTETEANALGLKFRKLGLETDVDAWEGTFKQAAKDARIALIVIENARQSDPMIEQSKTFRTIENRKWLGFHQMCWRGRIG